MANVRPQPSRHLDDEAVEPSDIRVPLVAAILMAGEIFRKGLKENEATAVATRLVGVAKVIVDAADKS